MAEYRITIGSKTSGPGLPGGPPSKFEMLKVVLLGLVGLGIVIGVVLAAIVVGSTLASLLLILLAGALVTWVARYLLRKLKRRLDYLGESRLGCNDRRKAPEPDHFILTSQRSALASV